MKIEKKTTIQSAIGIHHESGPSERMGDLKFSKIFNFYLLRIYLTEFRLKWDDKNIITVDFKIQFWIILKFDPFLVIQIMIGLTKNRSRRIINVMWMTKSTVMTLKKHSSPRSRFSNYLCATSSLHAQMSFLSNIDWQYVDSTS